MLRTALEVVWLAVGVLSTLVLGLTLAEECRAARRERVYRTARKR